jgi:predicted nucleic acid-binding protein
VAVARPLYLVDKSALMRLKYDQVDGIITPLMRRGQLATCGVIDLEVLFSARSPAEYESVLLHRLTAYQRLPITERVVERALEVQRTLAAESHHRVVGISDLLIAACADVNRAVLLHYDHDFDLVAEITGQSAVWVAPRGTVP